MADPFSWFSRPTIKIEAPIVPAVVGMPLQLTSTLGADPVIVNKINDKGIIEEKPEIVERIITKTVPVEKIIEKIVTVPDEAIVAENIRLKSSLEDLKLQMMLEQSAREENPRLKKEINELTAGKIKLQTLLKDSDTKILELNNKIRELNEASDLADLNSRGIQNEFGYAFFKEMWTSGHVDLLNRLCSYVRDFSHRENHSSLSRICVEWQATFTPG